MDPNNPTPTPTAAPAPDLMGYRSVDDLVAAKRASDAEAKRMNDRLRALETVVASVANPRQQVTNRDPFQRLDDVGVPVDAIRDVIGQEVQGRVQEMLEPIVRGTHARQQVISRYPDYQKYEADVARFVESDPQLSQAYQRMFTADPEAAMEYAILKFGNSRAASAPPAPAPSPAANGDQLPNMRSGDSREQPETREGVRAAWDHFQKTGNPAAYAKARLREIVPDSYLQR